MTIQDLQAKRAKLLVDAHAIMAGSDVTAEQRIAVDKMLTDANTVKADIERTISLEAADAEMRSVPGRVPQGAVGDGAAVVAETRTYDERRAATTVALRAALQNKPFETRDLTVSADGAFVIPVGVTDPKIARKDAGSVYDIVYKFRSSTGESVKVPFLNDITNGFVLNSAAITTTDPAVGGVTIAVDDIRSNPILLDNSLLQDVEFDLIGFVERATQSRYLRTVSNWITNGNTSNVAGLASAYTGVTTAANTAIAFGDLRAMIASLDPAYAPGATFLMSNLTLVNEILGVVDSNGRPLFLNFLDGGTSGFAGSIFGYPVKLNPYSASFAAGAVSTLMFGDFSEGYTFREVLPGIVLKKSVDRWIELNRTGFVAFARVGGSPTNAGSVSSTPSPIVALEIHA